MSELPSQLLHKLNCLGTVLGLLLERRNFLTVRLSDCPTVGCNKHLMQRRLISIMWATTEETRRNICLISNLDCRLTDGWMAGWLAGWMPELLAGWLVGWLAG